MPTSALPIIEEILRAGGPQQRKNALTALSVVGDEASVQMLAERAVGDDDAGVREHALGEVAALGEEKAAAVVGVFEKELHGGDRAKQVRAYAVLGRLQSVGAYEAGEHVKLRRKLLLAASLYKHLYLVRNWDFRLRSWRPGLLGSLVGGVIVFLATIQIFVHYGTQFFEKWAFSYLLVYSGIVLLLVGAGAVMSMVATQRSTPINLHISRFAALPVEALSAALLGFIGLLACYLVSYALLSEPLKNVHRAIQLPKDIQTYAFILLGGGLAGVVRTASVLAFGVYAHRRVNWLAEVLAGATAGFMLGVLIILFSVRSNSISGFSGWLISMACLPLAIGCASAFASIDIASPPARSMPGRSGLILRILFFPILLALGLAVGYAIPPVSSQ